MKTTTILSLALLFLITLSGLAADTQSYKNVGIQLSIPLEWQVLDKDTMATFQEKIAAMAQTSSAPVLTSMVTQ